MKGIHSLRSMLERCCIECTATLFQALETLRSSE
jgi:hypothetical protein